MAFLAKTVRDVIRSLPVILNQQDSQATARFVTMVRPFDGSEERRHDYTMSSYKIPILRKCIRNLSDIFINEYVRISSKIRCLVGFGRRISPVWRYFNWAVEKSREMGGRNASNAQ